MPFNLATLFVTIKAEDSAFSRSLAGIRSAAGATAGGVGGVLGGMFGAPLRAANSLANTIGAIGKGVAMGGVVAAVGGVAVAMYKGVSGAMALQDTMSATDAIFGSSSGAIFKWADDMAARFGAVKNESIGAAQQFGASFKQIGKSPEEAAALGTQVAKLGMDMASFKGSSNAEAFTAINAALRGEFDPLERFNVMLSAAAVSEEAMRMGLVKSAKDMDEASKKTAALSLIMKKTADQQGDLERTSDQSSNTWKKLTGTLENLATDTVSLLMPALTSVLNLGADMAVGLAALFESNKAAIVGWGATIVGWVDTARAAWRNLDDVWEISALRASAGFLNFLNVLAVIPENAALVGKYFANNWYQLIYDGVSAAIAVFKNFGQNLKAIVEAVVEYMKNPMGGFNPKFVGLTEGFAATADALPELIRPALTDVDRQISEVEDRMAARELERLSGPKAVTAAAAAVTKPAQQAVAEAAAREKAFKSESFGVADFAGQMRRDVFSDRDDKDKKALKAQESTAANTKKIADSLDGGVKARLA